MRTGLDLAPDSLRRVVPVRVHPKDPPLHQVHPISGDMDKVLDRGSGALLIDLLVVLEDNQLRDSLSSEIIHSVKPVGDSMRASVRLVALDAFSVANRATTGENLIDQRSSFSLRDSEF